MLFSSPGLLPDEFLLQNFKTTRPHQRDLAFAAGEASAEGADADGDASRSAASPGRSVRPKLGAEASAAGSSGAVVAAGSARSAWE